MLTFLPFAPIQQSFSPTQPPARPLPQSGHVAHTLCTVFFRGAHRPAVATEQPRGEQQHPNQPSRARRAQLWQWADMRTGLPRESVIWGVGEEEGQAKRGVQFK